MDPAPYACARAGTSRRPARPADHLPARRPGHAPGHLAFYIEDEGLVLSGDALFAGSVGRADLPGGSMEVLMRSIEERLLTLPDETRVFPGHGPQTEIGNERTSNPFLQGGLF